jgi:hypothetical protein
VSAEPRASWSTPDVIAASIAILLCGLLIVLNALVLMTPDNVNALSGLLALVPVAAGSWGYPVARRRGDTPRQAFRVACAYTAGIALPLVTLGVVARSI